MQLLAFYEGNVSAAARGAGLDRIRASDNATGAAAVLAVGAAWRDAAPHGRAPQPGPGGGPAHGVRH